MEQKELGKCSVVSCAHNLAYGGGPPEMRRCTLGRSPDFDSVLNIGSEKRQIKIPCAGTYRSGVEGGRSTPTTGGSPPPQVILS